MAEWRIGKGWPEEELESKLNILPQLERNFSDPADQMTNENGWQQYYSEATIARGKPGLPDENGFFERGCKAVTNYEFSDPRIVIAHFNPDTPLPERHMLLEMRAFRILHYLSGVVVGAVRSEQNEKNSVFGFRYDTLKGHIEKGTEWFLLTKEHETGEIRMRIEASWRPGQFPNRWSRLGFSLVGPHYQKLWHHHAHRRMARIVHRSKSGSLNREEGQLVHTDPNVVFKRFKA